MKQFTINEKYGRLQLKFSSNPVFWHRHVSDLLKDKVLLDLENASRLAKKDNKVVYTVYNLWKFAGAYKHRNVLCDLTLLRYGVFSLTEDGELFSTYGHTHGKKYAELYKAIKNDCFLMLVDLRSKKSYLVELKEGETFLVSHQYIHKLIVKDKDCLVAGFTLPNTGHDYNIVKCKGFPFHLFKIKGEIIPVANTNYKNFELITKKNKTKIDAEKLFFEKEEKMVKILKQS